MSPQVMGCFSLQYVSGRDLRLVLYKLGVSNKEKSDKEEDQVLHRWAAVKKTGDRLVMQIFLLRGKCFRRKK